jgi:hypothetical protein
MSLFADSISLGQPRGDFIIHIIGVFESESVKMIPGRESLDAAKTRMLEPSRQNDVAIDPIPQNDKGGEAHAHLERDPRLLGQDRDGAVQFGDATQLVEDRANVPRFSFEMQCERVTTARMRLIAISELPFAIRASPQFGKALPFCPTLQPADRWIVRSAARYFFCGFAAFFALERGALDPPKLLAAIKAGVMPEAAPIIDIGRERE